MDIGHVIFTPSFSAACSAHLGLRSIARAMKTASAWPVAMMDSACSGSVIRPTAAVRILDSLRMDSAKGTWKFGLASILALWMAPPDDVSIKSRPSSHTHFGIEVSRSNDQPKKVNSIYE